MNLGDWLRSAAEAHPDREGLVVSGSRLTYADCLAHATRIGALLTTEGQSEFVLVDSKKTATAFLAVWGILLARRAYVPFSSDQSDGELRTVAALVGARTFICEREAAAQWRLRFHRLRLAVEVLPVDLELGKTPIACPPQRRVDRAPAYALFSSGTTGSPKGIVIEQSNVMNLIHWALRTYGLGHRIAGLAPLNFDLSVLDMFLAVAGQGTYVSFSDATMRSPKALSSMVAQERITFLQTVPSLWSALLPTFEAPSQFETRQRLESIRYLVLAGEPLHSSLARRSIRVLSERARVVNMYGPTETIHCSACLLDNRAAEQLSGYVPIGAPIDGTRFELLDADGVILCGDGIGDLRITGAAVGRGYLGSKGPTGGFGSHQSAGTLTRHYQTGDLVERRGDELFFLGRADQQVKIAGHRLNLGLVEDAALSHPDISACAAVISEKVPSVLDLYVVRRPDSQLDARQLRSVLAASLPEWALPSTIQFVHSLPTGDRGKLDRVRLTAPRHTVAPGDTRQRFLLMDSLGVPIEHPQCAVVLPFTAPKSMGSTLSTAVVRCLSTGPRAQQLPADTANIAQEAPLPPTVKPDSSQVLSTLEALEQVELSASRGPVVSIVCSQYGQQRTIVAIRLHHAVGGGLEALALLGASIRHLDFTRLRLLEGPYGFQDYMSLANDDPFRAHMRKEQDECRLFLVVPPDLRRRAFRFFREHRLTPNAGWLYLHLSTLRVAAMWEDRATTVEMPVIGRLANLRVPESASLFPVMAHMRLVSADLMSPSRFFGLTSRLSFDSPKAVAQHRWNFTPVATLLGPLPQDSQLVPLDLWDQLPRMEPSLITSALFQDLGESSGIVCRFHSDSSATAYSSAFRATIQDILLHA